MKKNLIISLFILLAMAWGIKSQWIQIVAVPPGGGITDMVVTPGSNIIVTRGSFNYPNGQLGGISWSSNQGGSWVSPINVFTARTLELSSTGATVYASVWNYPSNEGLYRSISEGTSWTGPLYSVGANDNIFSICSVPNVLFIGTRNGVLKSTSGGSNFFPVNNGIPANSWVYDLARDANNIIAAATTNGVFISTNLGSSWQQTSGIQPSDTITTIIALPADTSDFAEDRELLLTSDDGTIYKTSINEAYLAAAVSAIIGSNIYYVEGGALSHLNDIYLATRLKNLQRSETDGGVFLSTDRGETFTIFNEGLPSNPTVSSIAIMRVTVSSSQLFAGLYNNTMNGGVTYKRTVPIGIEPISSEVPQGFSLSQNYPNPFNPSTNFEFRIAEFGVVSLKIYDLLGREITVLVNEELKAGVYKAEWDASDYPSGVYLYRLAAGSFTETKKMILIK